MKVWKRCIAALLSFTILYTSTNLVQAAGTFNEKFQLWIATKAEVLAEYYDLSDQEAAIILNDAIDQGEEYRLSYPYKNEENSKKNLITVDYLEKIVYARAYASGGYVWKPDKAVIKADGEEQETIQLTEGICYYNNMEYNAQGAFTYSGNNYTAEIIYELWVDVSAEEHQRILQIPSILAKTAKMMESGLYALHSNTEQLGEMAQHLPKLLSYEFPVEKKVLVDVEDEEGNITQEEQIIQTTEPAFDAETDAKLIEALNALYQECIENSGMQINALSSEYKNSAAQAPETSVRKILTYTFEKGAEVKATSLKTYEYINVIRNNSRLGKVLLKLKTEDLEFYKEIQNLQSISKSLVGNSSKAGPLKILCTEDYWTILDENVKTSIFNEAYKDEDLRQLEAAAYALRKKDLEIPAVKGDTALAATVILSCDVTIYDIHITVTGKVTSTEPGNKELMDMESATAAVKLLAGTSAEDVEKAIKATGVEQNALDAWNAVDSSYMVNSGNYEREVPKLPEVLDQNIDYKISYSPKYYKVNTNFTGDEKLPYGYQMELPVSENEDISYEYTIESEDGAKLECEEGVTYKITKDVTITQHEGAEKLEYRLYDFLVDDIQYTIDEEAKKILKNSAINSPTVKISIPDGSKVGEVVQENGIFSVTAANVKAGSNMTWIPHIAYVMDGDVVVQEVLFEDGVAEWESPEFSHVRVTYRLKIEKIKNGVFNQELEEENVKNALNLPYNLVNEVVTQNHLLGGDSGVTVKTLYERMESLKLFMSQGTLTSLGNSLKTTAGKNAVLLLKGSENEMVKNAAGKKLGYGAWDASHDQLALYTYMGYCADAGWSLAAYYRNGYYEPLSEHAALVADCLEKISADPGFVDFLEGISKGFSSYKEKVDILVPLLKELSAQLQPPNAALNVQDADFPTLIEHLLTMEGKVSKVDDSNGIYAYASFRKNGEKAGTLLVTVQAGAMLAKTKEIPYEMEGAEHILTDDEAAEIQAAIAELEAACGLTEEEKQYYEEPIQTAIPKAGDAVGKNEVVTINYTPKEYTVTVNGLDDYKATFKYKSDYVIELPCYSDNIEETSYYCYLIKKGDTVEEKKVYNGTDGFYKFTKEELIPLFGEDKHFAIDLEMRLNVSEWDVVPQVNIIGAKDDNVIYGSYFDFDNSLLFLDASPKGFKKAQFSKYVELKNGANTKVSYEIINAHRDPTEEDLLATGTIIKCSSLDQEGNEKITEIMLILMGDVNKDSIVDSADQEMLALNYLQTAAGGMVIGDTASKLAADMNGNGDYDDSNDALYIVMKYNYWGSSSSKKYVSVL